MRLHIIFVFLFIGHDMVTADPMILVFTPMGNRFCQAVLFFDAAVIAFG